MTRVQEQTLWVPGRTGWQGQQGSTTGLAVIGVVFALVVAGIGILWLTDPAPAIKALGVTALAALAVAVWMLVAHLRVGRVRVVRVVADDDRVVFGGARELTTPTRLLAIGGLGMLAAWAWALVSAPAESLPIVTLLGVPVVAIGLILGGIRAWLPAAGSHSLEMTPDRLTLRIPRNDLDVEWGDVQGAELNANRVHISARARGDVSFAARDLASDPVVLAELITFYAQTPRARAAIGPETLQLLSAGEF